METLSTFLAMGGRPAEGGGDQGFFLVLMIIMMVFFYMLMIRPQQRKEKERRAMVERIKSGDRILFAGGLLGLVSNVKENILVVKIADNVKIEVARNSVTQVMDKGEKPGNGQ